MTTKKFRSDLEVEYGRRNVEQSLIVWSALTKAVEKYKVWRFMIPGKGMPCFPVFEDNQGGLQLSKNPVSN